MKKHNYVYTIVRQTPDENGVRRGYIGVHCTDNLDDGYFGSGVYLKNAVKKYGQEDFVKTIVADFETEEEAVQYETELLHRMHKLSGGWELFSERFYNLKLNESRGKVSMSESTRKKLSESLSGEKHPMFGKTRSEETKKKLSESRTGEKNPMFGKTGDKHHMFGKTHSEESRKKMSEALSGEKHPMFGRTGEGNPMFGKTHSEETRKKMSVSRTGEKHNNFKGFTIGTNLENGKNIVFNGPQSMKARGFNHGNISEVLSGKRPHHKNFTFIRTKDPEILKNLLDQNNFCDEESKIIIEDFLQNL